MKIGNLKITSRDLVWLIICLVLLLCISFGMFIANQELASSALSSASTSVSIVFSLFSILYTMIEGANSSKINQESINKLNEIDLQLKETTLKLIELKELEKKIKFVAPVIQETVKKIEQFPIKDSSIVLDSKVKENIEYISKYISDDIDE